MNKEVLDYHLRRFTEITSKGHALGISFKLPFSHAKQTNDKQFAEITDHYPYYNESIEAKIAGILDHFSKKTKQIGQIAFNNSNIVYTEARHPIPSYLIHVSNVEDYPEGSSPWLVSKGQMIELSKAILEPTYRQDTSPFLIMANFDLAGPFNESIHEDIHYSKLL